MTLTVLRFEDLSQLEKGVATALRRDTLFGCQQMLQDLGPMTRFLSAIPAVLLSLAEAWNLERMFLQAFNVAMHLSNPLLSIPCRAAAMKQKNLKKKSSAPGLLL